jgi:6-pyruvoyltetrahydropterin/6-carboxytetrahydropterin synthase
MNKNFVNRIPVRVTKHVEFESCHRLVKYSGPCERMHGHTYKLQVTVEGVPDTRADGLVIDFKDLKKIINEVVVDKVDHQDLNEVMVKEFAFADDVNTSCENMIIAFWYALDHHISENFEGVKLQELKLWETTNSFATLTRDMVYGG